MESKILNLDSEVAKEALSKIEVIYTDLDGTLFAPGGRLLVDYSGKPSFATAKAIVKLQEVGIKIVIITGRSRNQGNEIMKILNADCFIGEMGTTKQENQNRPHEIVYDTGDYEWDSARYATPHDAIEASGAIEALLERYPGKIEPNLPWSLGRDVTVSLRGCIDMDDARAFLKERGFALDILDNGAMTNVKHNLVDCETVNGFHIVPANTSKALGISRDMTQHGYSPNEVVAIGDGFSDVMMGDFTGSFVLMANGADRQRNIDRAELLPCNVFKTSGRCCDGWVEFANAILDAKNA
ncbi:MAG: HAD family phosphatase [Coriobacteriales bacterium]|nr:HAD family phosphatase [Coriobacteriales bacterium]